MPYLICCYGEMGKGKTTVGKLLSKMTGIPFLEGDSLIPKDVKLESNAAVDKFVIDNLIPGIKEKLKENNNDLIFAYATYKKEHRDLIREKFKDQVDDVIFINIDCRFEHQMKNLWNRPSGARYWIPFSVISKFVAYEGPREADGDFKIRHNNDGEAKLIKQLQELPFYKKLQKSTVEYKSTIVEEHKAVLKSSLALR